MNQFIDGLRKTKERLLNPLRDIFASGAGKKELLEEVEEVLLSADMGIEASERIIRKLDDKLSRGSFTGDECMELLRKDLMEVVSEAPEPARVEGKPVVIVMVGVNGVGKTSTIGKLAYRYSRKGKKVLLAACDTFRAAAIEQLELWGERADVPVVRQGMGSDPAAVAFDAVRSAISRDMDVVIIDTAGRLHTKRNLMNELRKVVKVVSGINQDAVVESWLVLDANMGQNTIRQAEAFVESLPVTGIVLAKLDSTAKGGAIIPIQQKLGVPVLYVGVGEKIEDLQPFDREEFVAAITDKTESME